MTYQYKSIFQISERDKCVELYFSNQDWSEEVELNEKLEQEHLSRSSSVLSIRESANMPRSQAVGESHKRRKKKKRDKHRDTDR